MSPARMQILSRNSIEAFDLTFVTFTALFKKIPTYMHQQCRGLKDFFQVLQKLPQFIASNIWLRIGHQKLRGS
jgi:hypothetical protein